MPGTGWPGGRASARSSDGTPSTAGSSCGALRAPATLDRNLWVGPAKDEPIHRTNWHYDWHWSWNTGDGECGNWGVHIIDDVVNNVFRDQHKLDGDVRPIIVNVMNFNKPPKGQPALLSFDDARTLFHEFGHALHGLLSDVTYPSVAGTSVERDFVELPSQLYEHWLLRPEVLARFARHYKTGKPVPSVLLKRLEDRKIHVELSEAAKRYLVTEGYDLRYGARPLKRTIQREVLDPLALRVLQGEFGEGDRVLVDVGENGLRFEKNAPVTA